MSSDRVIRRLAFVAGGSALACMAVLAAGSHGLLAAETGLTAERIDAPLNPTTSVAPSYAPANPVDCTDPNNAITCPGSVDSPMVNGTAEPGSPYRD
jgi:hypothetical protein